MEEKQTRRLEKLLEVADLLLEKVESFAAKVPDGKELRALTATLKDIKSILADNISELRRSNNITQLELAEKLNYSDKAVSKWERAPRS